jgi:hypothetical protein
MMARATLTRADLKSALIAAHETGRALASGSKVADAAVQRFADRVPA